MTRPSPFYWRSLADQVESMHRLIAAADLSLLDPDTGDELSAGRVALRDLATGLRDAADQTDAAYERRTDHSLCRAAESREEHDHNRPEREEA